MATCVPPSVVSSLAWAIHDFAHLDSQIEDLATVLANASSLVPGCGRAGKQLGKIRLELSKILQQLDPEITQVVQDDQDQIDEQNIPF